MTVIDFIGVLLVWVVAVLLAVFVGAWIGAW